MRLPMTHARRGLSAGDHRQRLGDTARAERVGCRWGRETCPPLWQRHNKRPQRQEDTVLTRDASAEGERESVWKGDTVPHGSAGARSWPEVLGGSRLGHTDPEPNRGTS